MSICHYKGMVTQNQPRVIDLAAPFLTFSPHSDHQDSSSNSTARRTLC